MKKKNDRFKIIMRCNGKLEGNLKFTNHNAFISILNMFCFFFFMRSKL